MVEPWHGSRNDHELLGMRVRKRLEHHTVHNAEDRGVGADAEGEGQDGDGGEAGRFAQHAEGEATIRENRIEPILNMRLANH